MTTSIKERKKLGETWEFAYTAHDRDLARQTIAGVTDLAATLTRQTDDSVVWADDHAGVAIVESAPGTEGDFSYQRTDLTGITRYATYKLEFKATINGQPVKFPGDSYIIIEVI